VRIATEKTRNRGIPRILLLSIVEKREKEERKGNPNRQKRENVQKKSFGSRKKKKIPAQIGNASKSIL